MDQPEEPRIVEPVRFIISYVLTTPAISLSNAVPPLFGSLSIPVLQILNGTRTRAERSANREEKCQETWADARKKRFGKLREGYNSASSCWIRVFSW